MAESYSIYVNAQVVDQINCLFTVFINARYNERPLEAYHEYDI